MRQRVRDGRERELARAIADEAAAVQTLTAAADEVTRHRRQLDAATRCTADVLAAADLQRQQRYLARLRGDLVLLEQRRAREREALVRAGERCEQRRVDLAAAHTASEVAERAAERWDDAQLAEEQRRAELEFEELADARAARHSPGFGTE